MADVLSRVKRSALMSRIRSHGNKTTEVALARLLRANRISGWRRHLLIRATVDSSKLKVESRKRRGRDNQLSTKNHQLTVRPDFVFSKRKLAVFVDGCFWHGCPVHGTQPKGNAAFWRGKFSRNRARDRLVTRRLRRAGWRVLRIWEHELRRAGKNEPRLWRRIERALERLES